jgi:hypothetical protein
LGRTLSGVPVGRCPLPVAVPIILFNRCIQPHLDEVQNVLVTDTPRYAFHQFGMWDAVEVAGHHGSKPGDLVGQMFLDTWEDDWKRGDRTGASPTKTSSAPRFLTPALPPSPWGKPLELFMSPSPSTCDLRPGMLRFNRTIPGGHLNCPVLRRRSRRQSGGNLTQRHRPGRLGPGTGCARAGRRRRIRDRSRRGRQALWRTGGDADAGAEMFGVGCDRTQRLGRGDRRFFDTPFHITPNDPVGQDAFG